MSSAPGTRGLDRPPRGGHACVTLRQACPELVEGLRANGGLSTVGLCKCHSGKSEFRNQWGFHPDFSSRPPLAPRLFGLHLDPPNALSVRLLGLTHPRVQ